MVPTSYAPALGSPQNDTSASVRTAAWHAGQQRMGGFAFRGGYVLSGGARDAPKCLVCTAAESLWGLALSLTSTARSLSSIR